MSTQLYVKRGRRYEPVAETTLTPDELGTVAVCSTRYALGRRTYMPGLVCDFLRSRVTHLRDGDLNVIIRDIEKPMWSTDETRADTSAWGDGCDYREWMSALVALREESARRIKAKKTS